MRPLSRLTFIVLTSVAFTGCEKRTERYIHIGPDSLPTKSYEHRPEEPFNRSDYVIRLKQMTSFYDVPGEAGYFMNGEDYGFDGVSFILTETQPGGGPPLHTHDSEESHVVLHGHLEYVIGDRRFTVEGPYVARVAAHFPQCRNGTVQSHSRVSRQASYLQRAREESACETGQVTHLHGR